MYRIVCKFVPNQKTPTKGKFGAWRVVACMKATTASMAVSKPVLVVAIKPQPEYLDAGSRLFQYHTPQKLLVLSSPVPKQRNSWCNPRKILDAWLLAQIPVLLDFETFSSIPLSPWPISLHSDAHPLHDVGGT